MTNEIDTLILQSENNLFAHLQEPPKYYYEAVNEVLCKKWVSRSVDAGVARDYEEEKNEESKAVGEVRDKFMDKCSKIATFHSPFTKIIALLF